MARILGFVLNVIFLLLVLYLLRPVLRSLFGGTKVNFRVSTRTSRGGRNPAAVEGKMERDPVCGMFVSSELSHRLVSGRQTLHFCSRECLERYQKGAMNS